MKRYQAGALVTSGLYWSPRRWDLKAVSQQSNLLTGETGATYVRVPEPLLPFVLLFGAVAGGLYVVAVPLIGFIAALAFSGLRAWNGVRHGLCHLTAQFSDRWAPGQCHFCAKGRREERR